MWLVSDSSSGSSANFHLQLNCTTHLPVLSIKCIKIRFHSLFVGHHYQYQLHFGLKAWTYEELFKYGQVAQRCGPAPCKSWGCRFESKWCCSIERLHVRVSLMPFNREVAGSILSDAVYSRSCKFDPQRCCLFEILQVQLSVLLSY